MMTRALISNISRWEGGGGEGGKGRGGGREREEVEKKTKIGCLFADCIKISSALEFT